MSAQFPIRRMRRLRRTPALRRLVQETHIAPSQLIWPLFVTHGEGLRRPVTSLPGVAQLSVDQLVKRSEEHTSELQSQSNLVCRLLLEKKKKKNRKLRTCSV